MFRGDDGGDTHNTRKSIFEVQMILCSQLFLVFLHLPSPIHSATHTLTHEHTSLSIAFTAHTHTDFFLLKHR